MFNVLTNLTKAAVAVAVTPVALVADIVTLPASAEDPRRGPFDNTAGTLGAALDNLKEAIKPE